MIHLLINLCSENDFSQNTGIKEFSNEVEFTKGNHIPIVRSNWLADSISSNNFEPLNQYCSGVLVLQ